MRVSEIRVRRIRVNQGLGVLSYDILPEFQCDGNFLPPTIFAIF